MVVVSGAGVVYYLSDSKKSNGTEEKKRASKKERRKAKKEKERGQPEAREGLKDQGKAPKFSALLSLTV